LFFSDISILLVAGYAHATIAVTNSIIFAGIAATEASVLGSIISAAAILGSLLIYNLRLLIDDLRLLINNNRRRHQRTIMTVIVAARWFTDMDFRINRIAIDWNRIAAGCGNCKSTVPTIHTNADAGLSDC
jgi:hypothetical protein